MASNSKVKPLSGRAHGTLTVLMPHVSQLDARHAGGQIGLVLEEVEVAPGLPLGVVGRAVRRAAHRAGKAAARREVDLDVEPVCLQGRSRRAGRSRAASAPTPVAAERCRAWFDLRHVRPSCPSLALRTPPSRTLRAASRWPAAIPDRGRAQRLGERQAGTKKRRVSAEQRNIRRWVGPSGQARGDRDYPLQTARRHCVSLFCYV